MPDEDPKTWKQWGMAKLQEQGIAVLILIGVAGCLGFYIYVEIPKRDTAFLKALADQTTKFEKMFEDRDVRTLAYRTKSDERHAEERKAIREDADKNYNRLRDLLVALQKQGVQIEKRIEAMQ